MERTGAAVDCDRLAELGASTQVELDDLRGRIFAMAGEEFNLDSPKQLSRILFDVLGLTPLKKNQRGYSPTPASSRSWRRFTSFPTWCCATASLRR